MTRVTKIARSHKGFDYKVVKVQGPPRSKVFMYSNWYEIEVENTRSSEEYVSRESAEAAAIAVINAVT